MKNVYGFLGPASKWEFNKKKLLVDGKIGDFTELS